MQIATVVIPNLNGMKYLKDCLDSLRRQTRTDFSVILIDNGSTDGSADYVAQNYPGVRVERFSENRGFCGAVNAGIRMSSTRYVILLNNDTICDAQFVEQLVAAMEAHPDCFAGSAYGADGGSVQDGQWRRLLLCAWLGLHAGKGQAGGAL